MLKLRIGTRTSPLAMAQTKLVQTALKQAHPQTDFEVIGIETKTDDSVPMWQLSADAFVRELDEALLNGTIDCTVHSLKDLPTQRHEGIKTAALSTRENPRDIVIFSDHALEKIKNNEEIIIGTSSLRRNRNVSSFLEKALPYSNQQAARIKAVPLRGDIDTRLGYLHLHPKDKNYVDGVVLAVAGLNRLATDPKQNTLLQLLLRDTYAMILPLSECPTAPGQGALAIECRTQDKEIYTILRVLHDETTAKHVAREFKQQQHSCVLGATSISTKHFPDHILYVNGADEAGNTIAKITWPLQEAANNQNNAKTWDGTYIRSQIATTDYLDVSATDLKADNLFIAHSRATPPSLVEALKAKNVWTSGCRSWFRLAQQGIWVQGCTEELGTDIIHDIIAHSPFLNLPDFSTWQVLTHDKSTNDWPASQIVATYTVQNTFSQQAADDISTATHIFWSSASQYQLYKDYAQSTCHHYCRAGKTADILKSYNLPSLTVFPNSDMWRQCLKKAA